MAKRTALIAAGAILTIGGGLVSAAGGAVLATVGTDSRISSGTHAVSTTASAFVTEKGHIGGDRGTAVFGHPSIRISVSRADKPVFIGVAKADAVDRYLAGTAVETVTDLRVRPFKLTTTRQEGSADLSSPLNQSFWVEQAHGTTAATVNWNLHGGNYRVVVMNADGSPGVHVDGKLSARVPYLSAIGASVLGGGLFVALVGIALLVIGLRTKHDSYVASAAPSQLVGV